MVRFFSKGFILLAVVLMFYGCGYVKNCNVGLISFGDLEGKAIPNVVSGPTLQGYSNGFVHFLSDAARDALKDSEYDTLVNVKVTTQTGLWGSANMVIVEGTALNSKKLKQWR